MLPPKWNRPVLLMVQVTLKSHQKRNGPQYLVPLFHHRYVPRSTVQAAAASTIGRGDGQGQAGDVGARRAQREIGGSRDTPTAGPVGGAPVGPLLFGQKPGCATNHSDGQDPPESAERFRSTSVPGNVAFATLGNIAFSVKTIAAVTLLASVESTSVISTPPCARRMRSTAFARDGGTVVFWARRLNNPTGSRLTPSSTPATGGREPGRDPPRDDVRPSGSKNSITWSCST